MRIHVTSVFVDDQRKALDFDTNILGFEKKTAEFDRLISKGVRFTQQPTEMGGVTTAVFDDTCGNLIQIVQLP